MIRPLGFSKPLNKRYVKTNYYQVVDQLRNLSQMIGEQVQHRALDMKYSMLS